MGDNGFDSKSLKEVGIDYSEGVTRFAGHENLYLKYLNKFPADPEFPALMESMKDGRYEEAFRHAHTLKGITGNLSMNTFLESLKEFVERLRDNKDVEGAKAMFPSLVEQYNQIVAAITK